MQSLRTAWALSANLPLNHCCKERKVSVAQSCLTPRDPHGLYSPPDSSVHGILQARILAWVAMSFSRGSSSPRDQTWVSCIAGRFFTAEPLKGSPFFPTAIKCLIKSPQVGTHHFCSMSLLCLPLPDKAIKPFFSTLPKTVSDLSWHRSTTAKFWALLLHPLCHSFQAAFLLSPVQRIA